MSRRLRVLVAVCLVAVALGGAGLWALPEVVRRVAVAQISELTGRAASVEDVDLNLLTGRFAVTKLRIARRAGHGPDAFVEFDRLDGRVALLAALRLDVRIVELRFARPAVRVTRTGPLDFDVSDLLQILAKPATTDRPSRWTFSLDRLEVAGGTIVVDDAFLSPPVQWRVEGLGVEASGLTTRTGRAPGRLRLQAGVGEARFSAASESVRLNPPAASLDVSLSGFDLARVRPYLPADLPAFPETGTVALALRLERVRMGEALAESSLSGEIRLDQLSVAQRGRPAPFLRVGRLAVAIKRMDFLAREVTLAGIDVEGFDLKVARDRAGEVDLLAVLRTRAADQTVPGPPGEGPPAVSPGVSPGRGGAAVRLERLTLRSGTVTLDDEAVSPGRRWTIEEVTVDGAALSAEPTDAPGRVRVQARVTARPGSTGPARFMVDADAVTLVPPSATARVSLDGFALPAIEPYWPHSLPAVVTEGVMGFDLKVRLEQGEAGLRRAVASGGARLDGVSVVQRGHAAPFLRVPKLVVRLRRADAVARSVTVAGIDLEGVDLRAARDRTGALDLLAALGLPRGAGAASAGGERAPDTALAPPPRSAGSQPALRRVRLERLTLRSGTLTLDDEAVSPARQWRIEDVTVDGAGFSTSARDAPGTLKVRARVIAGPGAARAAGFALDADAVRVTPPSASARVSLDGLALAALDPYWPPSLPVAATGGVLGFTITVGVEQGDAGLTRGVASGSARLEGLTLVQRGHPAPFLTIPTLTVGLKQVDAVTRTVALGAVEVEGSALRVVRDAQGQIDLLAFAPAAEPAIEGVKSRTGLSAVETPPAPAAAPAEPPWQVSLDRFASARGQMTFEDHQVSPATTLALTDVTVAAQRIAWPLSNPASFSLSLGMPGGGRTELKGTATLAPLNVQVSASTRDAPIGPYRAYFPFAARLDGFFSGDSLSEIQSGPKGELILASRGTAWARDLEVRAPGVDEPVASLAAMQIRGIDFSWPNYALVERVLLTRPEVRVERDAQGAINLRTLFEVAKGEPSAAGPAPAAEPGRAGGDGKGGAPSESEGGLLQTIVLDFAEIDVRNGRARFVDRTTTPPFSEDISRLSVQIRNLSNVLGRPERTTMTAQALIGVDGALEMRGDLSGIGEALRADLVAELRDFSLPSTSPYADSLMSWTVQRGKLQAKVHYQVEGDRISATHDLELKGLHVAKTKESEEAKRRIGIPLGLAVALLKDSDGNIDFSIPLTGTLGDRSFDYGEAMWAAVKQVITKVLLAPFRAVGRLFKGGDDAVDKLEIDPVTFAPGSAVIAPSTEAQITKIAEFLRRSPQIRLALAPVVTEPDVDNLKTREVRARIEAFRRDRQLPDLASALRVFYQERLPDVAVPKAVEEQLALLAGREPVPTTRVAEMARRRLENTRNALVAARGIPSERVLTPAAPAPGGPVPGAGEGRVEFTIVAGDG